MKTIEAVLDSWALWEILEGSPHGVALRDKYCTSGHCSAWAFGELQAKLSLRRNPDEVNGILDAFAGRLTIHPVTHSIAREGARLRAELRRSASRASLADGVMLATARSLGLKLVSGDEAFKGQKDVVRA